MIRWPLISRYRQAKLRATLAAEVVARTLDLLFERAWSRAVSMPPVEAHGYFSAYARGLVRARVGFMPAVARLTPASRALLIELAIEETARRAVHRLEEARMRPATLRRAA